MKDNKFLNILLHAHFSVRSITQMQPWNLLTPFSKGRKHVIPTMFWMVIRNMQTSRLMFLHMNVFFLCVRPSSPGPLLHSYWSFTTYWHMYCYHLGAGVLCIWYHAWPLWSSIYTSLQPAGARSCAGCPSVFQRFTCPGWNEHICQFKIFMWSPTITAGAWRQLIPEAVVINCRLVCRQLQVQDASVHVHFLRHNCVCCLARVKQEEHGFCHLFICSSRQDCYYIYYHGKLQ